MKKEKLLTISIAAYNAEEFLAKAIESLILPDEWMKQLDIIVVNDGSTDGTPAIAEQYVRQYPDSIRLVTQENGGLGSTYNISSCIAKGKFYRLLDADDWFAKENMDDYLKYLQQTDADLILTPYVRFYENTKQERMVDRWNYLSQSPQAMDRVAPPDFLPAMHEMTVRTACIQPEGFHVQKHCFYVDNEYVFQSLTKVQTIAYCPTQIYCYRLGRDGQSVSLEGARKHYRDLVQVCESVYDCCEKKGSHALTSWERLSVLSIAHNTYNIFYLLDHPKQHKKELMRLDKKWKKCYPQMYQLTMCDWKIKLLRRIHFSFFGLYCRVKQLRYQ